ncbi:hypothetical protein FSW04_09250 [Baekduia soli]|uniref:Uncharacterized protein n=1 Tax=Baekduia soli TaxID=496014 RepID=A0A5B8U517_9ACTN|nr:hypothetical protein [Baekduia soli]QEC47742.1 hypothetical protein FSW04_09250 [Baekduia soli]
MQLLLRLPFLLFEWLVRRVVDRFTGAETAGMAWAPDPAPTTAEAPSMPSTPSAPPPPTAAETLRRSAEREAAAPPPRPLRQRPLRAVDHVDSGAEVVESVGPAEDVGGSIVVDLPWDGYDTMSAATIVARLRSADVATKGVVRLYEQQHKRRSTVLRATG